jgi:hypothetical protein
MQAIATRVIKYNNVYYKPGETLDVDNYTYKMAIRNGLLKKEEAKNAKKK